MTAVIEPIAALRSVERVLSTIAAAARIEGMVAPRHITFDPPRDGETIAYLTLRWASIADMRPWLSIFTVDPHKPDADILFADYFGWTVLLGAPKPVDSLIDAALAERACKTCGGELVHRAGCEHEPIPYIPVAMPTGDEANAAECARLNLPVLADDRQRLVHHVPSGIPLLRNGHELPEPTDHGVRAVDILTVDPDLPDAGRGDAEVARMVAPLAVTGDLALEFSHYRELQTHRVRIDTGGGVWLHVPGKGWLKVSKVDLSHLGVAEIDAHCDVENYLKRQPFASDEPSFEGAADRLQAQRDDAKFAEIVAEVQT